MIGRWLDSLPDEALDRILTKPMGLCHTRDDPPEVRGASGCVVQVALGTWDYFIALPAAHQFDALLVRYGGFARGNDLIRARCLRIKARRTLTVPVPEYV